MKRTLIFALLLFCFGSALAQSKFLTKNGVIDFEASVPSFEEVKAKNDAVTAILNTANGEFASLALMKGFRFKVALMEEHFNENYIESDEYPKATFKGKLSDFNAEGLNGQEQTYTMNGSLTLHGKTKELSVPVVLKKDGEFIHLTANFSVKPEDFDIEIPSIVSNKIAETIDVAIDFQLKEK